MFIHFDIPNLEVGFIIFYKGQTKALIIISVIFRGDACHRPFKKMGEHKVRPYIVAKIMIKAQTKNIRHLFDIVILIPRLL